MKPMKKLNTLIILLAFILSACNMSTKEDSKRNNQQRNSSNYSQPKKDCDTNCKYEAREYVRKLCKESGSWDDSSIDLWSRSVRKVGDKEYAVEIYYPNLEGGPHTAEEVVRVDCDCNIVSSRRRKN